MSDEIPAEAVEAAHSTVAHIRDRRVWRGDVEKALLAALPHLLADKDAKIERLAVDCDYWQGEADAAKVERNALRAERSETRARWVEQLQSDEAVQAATDAWSSRESSRWPVRMRAALVAAAKTVGEGEGT